jgi:hypothetical protein
MARLIANVIAAAAVLGACGRGEPLGDVRSSSVQLALGNDFSGKYLRVWGERTPAASSIYPCINAFEVCIPLDGNGATAAVHDLCPSDDTPEGTWSYKGIVYADAACTQPLANFGCLPDEGEWIGPGHNKDDIQCITRNADKSFDLCVIDPVTGSGSAACRSCIPNPACAPPAGSLTHANVSEFDGKTAIPVAIASVGGDTRVTIGVAASWPVENRFLGFDHFSYNASSTDHPVIRVADEGCDEAVVSGWACGWHVNFDGSTADGFGTFASRTNSDSASHGGSTQPLVFWLRGSADITANEHGAKFALHGRFGDGPGTSAGCSGWFSDGTSNGVDGDAGCAPVAYCPCD